MSYTKADLRNRILKHLKLLGSDQGAPPPEDAETVEEIIDTVHEGLLERGLVWFETSAIPTALLQPLAKRIGLEVRPSFDGPDPTPLEIELAERDIRKLAAGGRPPEPITANYF